MCVCVCVLVCVCVCACTLTCSARLDGVLLRDLRLEELHLVLEGAFLALHPARLLQHSENKRA